MTKERPRAPHPPVFFIAGPTAGGKSALALALAERTGAAVINADSMQVYRDLRVITARPSAQDMARAPHHLFGHVDAAVRYSAGQWAREASARIAELGAAQTPAIVVGGTGLYIEALTEGIADIPDIAEDARTRIAALAVDPAALLREAHARDPDAAQRVEPGDRHRLIRIVEVHASTGRTLTDWRARTHPIVTRSQWAGMALVPPRQALYDRINARSQAILAGGRGEAGALLDRRLPPELPIMKALGVTHLARLMTGTLSQSEALELLQRDTRRYAKRQMTWIRGRMADWPVIEEGDVDAALALWMTAHAG